MRSTKVRTLEIAGVRILGECDTASDKDMGEQKNVLELLLSDT